MQRVQSAFARGRDVDLQVVDKHRARGGEPAACDGEFVNTRIGFHQAVLARHNRVFELRLPLQNVVLNRVLL